MAKEALRLAGKFVGSSALGWFGELHRQDLHRGAVSVQEGVRRASLNWTAGLRSPLTAPGVDVKAGEFLLAVRGVDLKPPTEVFSLFENTAGNGIESTVGPNADGTGSRTVTVEPIANESTLRNRDWVERNLK